MTARPDDRLDSWKEIAAYLGRSVRTVRRWEAEEGLPVHRQMHRALGNVYAFRSEVDRWREDADRAKRPAEPAAPSAPRPAAQRSVAVLPFANLGRERDDDYLADGLTEEVIADLSSLGGIRVISRTSSVALKGTGKDVRTIGRELGVGHVVEGAVRRDGTRLRISARLIDARTDQPVWSDRFEGTVDDLLNFEEQLARTIAGALELRLTPDEERRLSARGLEDPRAYECYLRGRQELLRWNRKAIDHAVQLLRAGVAIAGDNARLHASLGRAWLQYREAGIDFGERPLREAAECARRVFALDPGAAAGFQLRGWMRYASGDVQEAVRDLRAALELEPHDPDTLGLLANCLLISGRVEAARPLITRLIAVDPLTPLTRCMPGWADLLDGDLAAALAPYRSMYEMDRGNPMARLFYLWVLALNGRGGEISEVAQTIPQPAAATADVVALFLTRAFEGDARGARETLTEQAETAARATELFPRFLAHGYALAGMPDPAIDWIAVAADRGFINHPFLARHDPILRRLDGEPRFDRLLDHVQGRWKAFEA